MIKQLIDEILKNKFKEEKTDPEKVILEVLKYFEKNGYKKDVLINILNETLHAYFSDN